jgi:hypothetical protein
LEERSRSEGKGPLWGGVGLLAKVLVGVRKGTKGWKEMLCREDKEAVLGGPAGTRVVLGWRNDLIDRTAHDPEVATDAASD